MAVLPSTIWWGVVAGVGLGLGLWSMVASLPRLRRLRLDERLAPYLLDVSSTARAEVERVRGAHSPVLGALLGPALASAHSVVLTWLGGEASVALRLRQAGIRLSVDGFRLRQFVVAAAGALVGLTLAAVIQGQRPVTPVAWVALAVVFGLAGFLGHDALLRILAKRRLARLAEEFPTVAELRAQPVGR